MAAIAYPPLGHQHTVDVRRNQPGIEQGRPSGEPEQLDQRATRGHRRPEELRHPDDRRISLARHGRQR
jgi:hypothetical protein